MSRPCVEAVTLGFIWIVAIILLAVWCSVFLFKASITEGELNGSIIFGTLGYCVELANGTSCSKYLAGYEPGQCSPFHPPLFMTGLNFFYQISTALSKFLIGSPRLWQCSIYPHLWQQLYLLFSDFLQAAAARCICHVAAVLDLQLYLRYLQLYLLFLHSYLILSSLRSRMVRSRKAQQAG